VFILILDVNGVVVRTGAPSLAKAAIGPFADIDVECLPKVIEGKIA
jgi:hypothetical protein